MKRLLLLLFIVGSIHVLSAQSIRIAGDWNYSIPNSDITNAGEDFTGIYTSTVNQVYLDVRYFRNWVVSIQKNNIDWEDKINIWLHRTGNGFGIGRIQGGKNYIQLIDKEIKFITGNGLHYFIPLQFQARNISVTIPAHNYVTEIMYTLSAN